MRHQAWCLRSRLVATVLYSCRMLNHQGLVQVGQWEAIWAVHALVVHIQLMTLETTLMVEDDRPHCRSELWQHWTIHTRQRGPLHHQTGGHRVGGTLYSCRSSTNQGPHTLLLCSVNLLCHCLCHLPLSSNKLIPDYDHLDPIPKWGINTNRGPVHL